MPIRLIDKVKARDLKPGSKVEVFSAWYFIRYIKYQGNEMRLALQPESVPLSPLYEDDVITMFIPDSLIVEIEVEEE